MQNKIVTVQASSFGTIIHNNKIHNVRGAGTRHAKMRAYIIGFV